ncbi:MAG: hypothetical protein M1833_007161 [Piccolia ochrophora]|nr:MAG: hypothetical protein M1833_007161 [Piccolia ochrophora]
MTSSDPRSTLYKNPLPPGLPTLARTPSNLQNASSTRHTLLTSITHHPPTHHDQWLSTILRLLQSVSQSPTASYLKPQLTTPFTAFHFFAGLASGLSTSVLLQPADLLKTRLQQSRHTSLLPTLRAIAAGPSPFAQLWRGTLPSALRTGFGSALYFSGLNTLRRLVSTRTSPTSLKTTTLRTSPSSALPTLPPSLNLLTGAVARAAAGLAMMPATVLKVRYESSLYSYGSLASAAKAILRAEGTRGFFAGYGATAVRDAPYAGLYVVFYEAGKAWFARLAAPAEVGVGVGVGREDRTPPSTPRGAAAAAGGAVISPPVVHFSSALLAAVLATALTNPFDAVKTRIQLLPGEYRNMLVATRRMVGEEGVRSLFDGLGLRMARKALSSALAWTVYEELVRRGEGRLEAVERGVV